MVLAVLVLFECCILNNNYVLCKSVVIDNHFASCPHFVIITWNHLRDTRITVLFKGTAKPSAKKENFEDYLGC